MIMQLINNPSSLVSLSKLWSLGCVEGGVSVMREKNWRRQVISSACRGLILVYST